GHGLIARNRFCLIASIALPVSAPATSPLRLPSEVGLALPSRPILPPRQMLCNRRRGPLPASELFPMLAVVGLAPDQRLHPLTSQRARRGPLGSMMPTLATHVTEREKLCSESPNKIQQLPFILARNCRIIK